jgi:uncharacterized UPF0160 family protein
MENKEKLTIVTHGGNFHPDDVFSLAVLKTVFKDKNLNIIRTRDEKIIKEGDYVFDVGGIYDESKNRFDHHQEGGAGRRENNVPYASIGLVWKKFGEEVCGSKEVADEIDKKLIQ